MKLYNNKQLLVRLVAAVTEAILFYLGFLFVNQLFNGSGINVIFFIITALCGLFVHFLPYNSSDKHKHTLVFGSIGLALAIGSIGISAIFDFSIFTILIGFIALASLYYRSYTSYLSNIIYVYTIENFYQALGLLFLMNGAVAFFYRSLGAISPEMMRYSVLYLVVALYVLSAIKGFKYTSRSEGAQRPAFDRFAPIAMIGITVVMSIPSVFRLVSFPFVVVFKFVYGIIGRAIVLITYPIARFANFVYDLIPKVDQQAAPKPNFGNMQDMPKKYHQELMDTNNPLVQVIGKVLTIVLMLAICVFVAYVLFKFIDRIAGKDEEEDFEEDKEFILRNKRQKGPGLLQKLAGSVKKATDGIAFMLTADNRERLRYEYKGFIQKLHHKKIIEHYNYTAQDILELMLAKLPEQKPELVSITGVYEEVRYGTRYPEDAELKSFRKNIAEISKNLQ